MKFLMLRFFTAISLVFFSYGIQAQGFAFNCTRDTAIAGCIPICITLKGVIPDLYSLTNTYTLNPTSDIPSCFPMWIQPDDPGGSPTNLTIDDRYSAVIPIGFAFPFYGTVYNNLIASTNGYLSFDISNAGGAAHWVINQDLPSNSYNRAMIMGPNHDLNPNISQPTQRIQYQTMGTAPHRRWVLSYYRVPLFGSACVGLIENTHQIVLYESTGIIEVTIRDKQTCTGWNSGRAIVGIQDWNRTQAMMAPGRTALGPTWGAIGLNESWRFEPASGPSLFRRVELLDLSGTIISTGTTAPYGPGRLEASFPNTCIPAAGLTTYLIRSVYTKIDNPSVEIFGVDTIRVTRANAIQATPTTTATLCNGAGDGTITVTPTAGVGPFTYSLDGGPAVVNPGAQTYTGVTSGDHTIDIVDANGCTLTLNVMVNAGPSMITTVNKTDALCNGATTGSITVTPPTIGTPPYQYSIDGTTWQSSNIFNGLPAGTYTVHYRSADICPGNSTITITEPASLGVLTSTTNGTCNGIADGSITVSASGGTPGYQYSLDGITYQASNVFNVAAGNYTVSVKDNNGCITTYPTVVGLTNDLTFVAQADETICEGSSVNLSMTSNATGYSWSPATGLDNPSVYNPTANPVVTTRYIVRANLGLCFIEDTVMVNVNAAPIPNAGADGFICYGQTYQLGASGGTQYSWTPSTYLDDPTRQNPISSPTKDITYTVSILSDINGCASLTTDQMRLDVTPPIKVKTFPYDTVAYQGNQFHIRAVPNDLDVIDYSWSPAMGLTDPKLADPIVTAGAIGDIAYYKVTTSTIAGCKGEGFVTVRVYKGPDVYVPTGFTPNGDGKNDKFTPFPVGMKSYKYFRVFNRWGQLVFSSSRLHDGWDGRLGGRDQPAGTYVWMIEGTTNEDKVITKKGTITLIR